MTDPGKRIMKTSSISAILGSIETLSSSTSSIAHDLLSALARLEDADIQKRLLKTLIEKYVLLEKQVDGLLKNTLPPVVAEEIKSFGHYDPRPFEATIFFTDCAGFTKLAEKIPADVLIGKLHELFLNLDHIIEKHAGVKIKTIGDAYMAVFGAPLPLPNHEVCAVNAALDAIDFIQAFNLSNDPLIEMRIGIHAGRVMGAVVGKDRMQFDIFGDDVNIASRFESSGEKGRINVSETIFQGARERFLFQPRGEIALKNKAPMSAYFVLSRC